MAVEDEEAINPSCSRFGVLVKVLNPSQTKIIGSPTIFGRSNYLVFGQWAVLVPRREAIAALDDDERWDRPA